MILSRVLSSSYKFFLHKTFNPLKVLVIIHTGSTANQFPQNVTEGKTMFLVNLAVAHCLREEFDKAKKCLYQVRRLATSRIGCSKDV